jgi:hypothetical protein
VSDPLAFAPDVMLLRPTGTDDDRIFVMVGGAIRYELADEAWRQVLLRVDGSRSLAEILRGLGMPESAIKKPLEDALDEGILRFVPRISMVTSHYAEHALAVHH